MEEHQDDVDTSFPCLVWQARGGNFGEDQVVGEGEEDDEDEDKFVLCMLWNDSSDDGGTKDYSVKDKRDDYNER